MSDAEDKNPTSDDAAANPVGGDSDANASQHNFGVSSDKTAVENESSQKEPSLGPACLVVTILSLAVFCSVCGFGSWWVFSDQYPLAERGIEQQLIPWVETSQLPLDDRESIVDQLQKLLPKLREREIDKGQLSRLRNCLQDNPILLWGGVESILAQAEGAGLSETEIESLDRITDRLMRMATQRKLGRNDLEFTIQNCCEVRADQLSVEVKNNLTAAQIREFMKRAEQLVEENDVPNEPYDKTPAEAFRILIESALDEEVAAEQRRNG